MANGDDLHDDLDNAGTAIDPWGVVARPTTDFPDGYVVGVTRYADVVLSTALPERFDDIIDTLSEFMIQVDEFRMGGGGRADFTRRFDETLGKHKDASGNEVWGKRNITIERSIGFDEDVQPQARTRGHEIDMFGERAAGSPFPGVAVEMEWNNKDPFYDRDLNNFEVLHREGAIAAGVIVTRGPELQDLLGTVLDKYGTASTHWDKLIPKVNLGGGGECPLLLIGIEPGRIDDPELMWEHYQHAVAAQEIKDNWRHMTRYDSWADAKPDYERYREMAHIGRLQRPHPDVVDEDEVNQE